MFLNYFRYIHAGAAKKNLLEFLELRFTPLERLSWAWKFLTQDIDADSSKNDSTDMNLYGRDPGEACYERWAVDCFLNTLAWNAVEEIDKEEGKKFMKEHVEELKNVSSGMDSKIFALNKRSPEEVLSQKRVESLLRLKAHLAYHGFSRE